MSANSILASLESRVLHEGASREAISRLEELIGRPLPPTYVELMSQTNGFEGFLGGDNYVLIWPVEQIPALNAGYADFVPGLLFFGSNGGASGYAFDTGSSRMPVKEVPFIGMSHEEAKTVGATFEEFLDRLSEGPV